MSTATTEQTIEQTAAARVNNSDALRPYSDLLLSYDWSNRDEHLAWVANAPEGEIIAWAEAIRRDEASAA
jgi:hypothetical protein